MKPIESTPVHWNNNRILIMNITRKKYMKNSIDKNNNSYNVINCYSNTSKFNNNNKSYINNNSK